MARARYESEYTQFMRELLQRKPGIVDQQRAGRALWWDKEIDREQQRRFRESRIAQLPYVYQTKT